MPDDGKIGEAAADETKRTAEQMQRAGDRVADQTARAGEAMKQSGQKMAEGGSALSVKMLDQAETNTQQAFAAMRAAAEAKDLTEVMKIQGDYLREQGSRSVAQMREISELIMQFGRDAVAPLKGGMGGEPPR